MVAVGHTWLTGGMGGVCVAGRESMVVGGMCGCREHMWLWGGHAWLTGG